MQNNSLETFISFLQNAEFYSDARPPFGTKIIVDATVGMTLEQEIALRAQEIAMRAIENNRSDRQQDNEIQAAIAQSTSLQEADDELERRRREDDELQRILQLSLQDSGPQMSALEVPSTSTLPSMHEPSAPRFDDQNSSGPVMIASAVALPYKGTFSHETSVPVITVQALPDHILEASAIHKVPSTFPTPAPTVSSLPPQSEVGQRKEIIPPLPPRDTSSAIKTGQEKGHVLPAEDVDYDNAPEEFYCPITSELLKDPVIACDGQTYERAAIEDWFQLHPPPDARSPMTNQAMDSTALIPNVMARKLVQDYLDKRLKK